MINIESITSFYYILLVCIGALVYYLAPKKTQWVILLLLSVTYYILAGNPYTYLYILFVCVAIHLISRTFLLPEIREKAKQLLLITGIVLCILPWFLFGADFVDIPLAGALGMGYYTCMSIAYLVDCYWSIITPQKNPLKLLLYLSFFPQLVTGPINRYDDMSSLYEKHVFSYKNLCFGAQRILWGFCKKLILAERLAVIFNGICNNLNQYKGYYYLIALFIYPLYLYSDFSGCMDICLGVAEIFDIKMAENFKNPFFSRNIREFWRRWHITLGKWAKDFIMYPLLKSGVFVNMSKKLRKKLSKNAAKIVTTALASAAVWFVMGVWHGGFKHIVGVSLYYWILVEAEELLEPILDKVNRFLKIKTESFGWHLFQSVRTYIFYSFGAIFFAAPDVRSALEFLDGTFLVFIKKKQNPWIFFDESILGLGIKWADINIIIIMVCLLMVVACLREKYDYARNFIAKQSVGLRWFIWIGLFTLILIYGYYGPGFSVTEFIYKEF